MDSFLPKSLNKLSLETSIPGETHEQLKDRILSAKINKDKFFANAKTFNWKLPGIPSFAARMFAREAEKNPDPYLRSLQKVNPNTIMNAIKQNEEVFRGVSNSKNYQSNIA